MRHPSLRQFKAVRPTHRRPAHPSSPPIRGGIKAEIAKSLVRTLLAMSPNVGIGVKPKAIFYGRTSQSVGRIAAILGLSLTAAAAILGPTHDAHANPTPADRPVLLAGEGDVGSRRFLSADTPFDGEYGYVLGDRPLPPSETVEPSPALGLFDGFFDGLLSRLRGLFFHEPTVDTSPPVRPVGFAAATGPSVSTRAGDAPRYKTRRMAKRRARGAPATPSAAPLRMAALPSPRLVLDRDPPPSDGKAPGEPHFHLPPLPGSHIVETALPQTVPRRQRVSPETVALAEEGMRQLIKHLKRGVGAAEFFWGTPPTPTH